MQVELYTKAICSCLRRREAASLWDIGLSLRQWRSESGNVPIPNSAGLNPAIVFAVNSYHAFLYDSHSYGLRQQLVRVFRFKGGIIQLTVGLVCESHNLKVMDSFDSPEDQGV